MATSFERLSKDPAGAAGAGLPGAGLPLPIAAASAGTTASAPGAAASSSNPAAGADASAGANDFVAILAQASGSARASVTPPAADPSTEAPAAKSRSSSTDAVASVPAASSEWLAQLVMPSLAPQPTGTVEIGQHEPPASAQRTPAGASPGIFPAMDTASAGAAPATQGARAPGDPADAGSDDAGNAGVNASGALASVLEDVAPGSAAARSAAARASATADSGAATPGVPQPSSSAAAATAASSTAASSTAAPALMPLHPGAATQVPDARLHELAAPLGSAAWVEDLGAHVVWMAHSGTDSARLQVSPPDLGPIEVHIAMHEGQASVWFGAAHPETRTALEQSLPRLRELFASSGLALADTGVSHEPPRQQSQPAYPLGAGGAAAKADERVTLVTRVRRGLIDLYA